VKNHSVSTELKSKRDRIVKGRARWSLSSGIVPRQGHPDKRRLHGAARADHSDAPGLELTSSI
jgi:hypothetical protein